MIKIVISFSFVAFAMALPQLYDATTKRGPFPEPKYIPNPYEQEQNRHAKYEFSSDVDDHISDLTNQRMEVRDGLKVRGSYSYSDGYHKRTVMYVADENGYRVVGEDVAPLAGPMVDLTGTASVRQAAHGRSHAYKVQSVAIPGPVPKIID